jgi:DNA-binding HxlR family transcriptional regulator
MPRPFSPVRGSRSGRPIMALLELLGRRWSLRVLWELRGESLSFRALRERCDDVSPSVLNQRLAELREVGLIDASEQGYMLTGQGRSLGKLLLPLDAWSHRWAKSLGRRE